MTDPYVIVGAGLSAAMAVEELRTAGHDGEIIVFGSESHLPYERPPLSKGYLLGNDPIESAFPHDAQWYADQQVELRPGTAVTAIDPAAHTVTAAGGVQPYAKLLLVTGASPRRLAMADDSGAPTTYLRTIEDSDRVKQAIGAGSRVAIIGGGWIGLEVAAAARMAGCGVTVLESLELPLLRVLGPEMAQVFADLHREHGVDLRTTVSVTQVRADGSTAVVQLEDGDVVTADLLVVGVGVAPNIDLAEAAGLAVDNGIVVDAQLRSSDPDVFAAGDVANAAHPVLGGHLRVEHWDNAIEQGRAAARSMVGLPVSYDRMPYFFTDQYDLGAEYVGHVAPGGHSQVVIRGDAAERVLTAFWLDGDTVRAGMQVNDWDATDAIRGLVGTTVDPSRL
ncbi:MAG: FAD-dependent oxidoreductase, partial [Actinomycetota bacterium]|nr:FAD-dependent oxidoreductase [Actinomycetota bacterium]